MEEWKDIKGYEGKYQISNRGRVKSLGNNKTRKEKILRPGKRNNYLFINLYKNGKSKKYNIHRLVAEHFLPNPDNLPVINHKDENKLNNNVENLEWCTQEYNMNYGDVNKKRSKKLTKKIQCIETGEIFNGSKDIIDRMFNGKGYPSNIRNNLYGRTKKAYGYTFKYIEE